MSASITVFRADGTNGHAVAMGALNGRTWVSSYGWFAYEDSIDGESGLVAQEMARYASSLSPTTPAKVSPAKHAVASKSADSGI